MQPAIGEQKTGRRGRRPLRRDRRKCAGIRRCADAGRRGRRPLRGARPETWRDKCGRGVPIGGVQTRDAGTGGVFRQAVIDRCGPSGRRIQNYVGCKALFLYGARGESFRAVRGSGSGDRSAGDSVRNPFAPQLQLDEREIQKPMVFGGVLFHISFAVERNMAAGGIEKKVVGPLRPKVTRARERGIFPAGSVGEKKSNGPSGPPAPTGCVYLGAPVFGKPPIWTQQSRCTITDRRVSAR